MSQATYTVTGTIPLVLSQIEGTFKDIALLARAECEYDEMTRQIRALRTHNDVLQRRLDNERSKTRFIFQSEREK
jgi:hypothetical protein